MKFSYIFLFLFFFPILIFSQTKVPGFFSDGMIMQQDQEVSFWGWDKEGQNIEIFTGWGEKVTTSTNEEGEWKVKLKTPKAGGPYSIRIEGTEKLLFEDILIGEVWFCSGQSNMEMPVYGYRNEGINGSQEVILNSTNDQIRMFTVKRQASKTPLNDVEGEWLSAKRENTGNFSATAYFFAKKLYEQLKVPVGIIHSSWGGSKIEAWIDKESINTLPDIDFLENIPEEKRRANHSPTLLYNGMVKPIEGYGIKGFCWYQGESNRGEPEKYTQLSKTMIDLWRNKWGNEELPFYFVQIAPFGYNNMNSAFLREAQLKCMQEVKNTGMAVTMDIGDCLSIHPPEKKKVADRLAYWALSKDYGFKGIETRGPEYQKMEVMDDGKVKLYFDYTTRGLTSFGKELNGFEIAGEDRKFVEAKVKINRDKTISVWADEVKEPKSVRYAFYNCIHGSLFNTEGLPASSFRTDDWPIIVK